MQSPEKPIYTFRRHTRNCWAPDAAIDHPLLSPAAARRLKCAVVDRDIRGLEGGRDHAPAGLTVTDEEARRASASVVRSRGGPLQLDFR